MGTGGARVSFYKESKSKRKKNFGGGRGGEGGVGA